MYFIKPLPFFTKLGKLEQRQMPDGHGHETSSCLDFETMDRAAVPAHCVLVFLGFDSRHYR